MACSLDVTWAALKASNFWGSLIYNKVCRNGKADRETVSHSMNARRSASIPTLLHGPALTILCHLTRSKLLFWSFFKMSSKIKAASNSPCCFPCLSNKKHQAGSTASQLLAIPKGYQMPRKAPLMIPLMTLWLNDWCGCPFTWKFWERIMVINWGLLYSTIQQCKSKPEVVMEGWGNEEMVSTRPGALKEWGSRHPLRKRTGFWLT